jgi:uncharacterized SAM-binding protein YcdF (DUF218 family)
METSEKPARNNRQLRRLVCAVVLLVLSVAALFAVRGLGRWLVREDPLAKADVIVILSGSMPYRAERAANYFVSGYAGEVWVSRPEGPAEDLKELGIEFVGEADYNREVLIHLDVPATAIQILPNTIIDTEQEVQEVARQMRQTGKAKVIIVTSPEHTRRVRALWSKLVGDNPRAIVRAAPEDPFDADHWWRNTRDALAVVREVLGLMNVWVGLPIRPHPH